MAGDSNHQANHIRETLFPEMPLGLDDEYLLALYGPKMQIVSMLTTVANQRELITNGAVADPRRTAVIDTIWQIFDVTKIYRYTGTHLIREWDTQFWETDFSDLMDELEFLDAPLNERLVASINGYHLDTFSGEFAMNLARMIIIANIGADTVSKSFAARIPRPDGCCQTEFCPSNRALHGALCPAGTDQRNPGSNDNVMGMC